MEDGSTVTRAATSLPEDKINNVWVFQFAGTADNSVMVGDPLYFDLDASQQGTIKSVHLRRSDASSCIRCQQQ